MTPTRQFAIVSLILIGLLVLTISLAVSYYLYFQVPATLGNGYIPVAVIAVALFLYLPLGWVVHQATRQNETQLESLQQQSRELAATKEELVSTQAEFDEVRRMAVIGEMVTAVTHGCRTPLASIRAWAQTAMLECRNCKSSVLGPQSLRVTIAEVDRLEAHLNELLQFARNPGRQNGPVDLNLVLRRIVEMRAVRMAQVAVKVDDECASFIPSITGDRLLIQETFVSLIDNAIKAMAESGGTLTLTTGTERDSTDELTIFGEVRDTGIGMPKHQVRRIMDPSYTSKAGGTGLGLALAKKFTEVYGGAIRVSSQSGEGTTFRVSYPTQRESKPSSTYAGGRRTVA